MTNTISKKAKIGKRVTLGPYTIVHDNVVIGNDTTIESHCVIGYPTKLAKGKPLLIQKDSHIRSHSIFYEGSRFGPKLVTGHSVLVRENCVAGRELQVGTNTIIDGDCTIGDCVKFHSDVILAKRSKIGHFVYLYPGVRVLNDPFPPSFLEEGVTIKDMAVLTTGALLLPGVTVGLGCFVAAGSVVRSDIPDLHCVSGNPAALFATLDRFMSPKYGRYHPWVSRFKGKYSKESYPLMKSIVEKIDRLITRT